MPYKRHFWINKPWWPDFGNRDQKVYKKYIHTNTCPLLFRKTNKPAQCNIKHLRFAWKANGVQTSNNNQACTTDHSRHTLQIHKTAFKIAKILTRHLNKTLTEYEFFDLAANRQPLYQLNTSQKSISSLLTWNLASPFISFYFFIN